MAKAKTENRVNWAWIIASLLVPIIGGWFFWQAFQPRAVDTSEGLEILKSNSIGRAVLNESTQQVNLSLTEPYTHESTGLGDRVVGLGKDVYFTYSYSQTEDILTAVANAKPMKGWNALHPRAFFLSSILQMLVPLLLLFGPLLLFMRSMPGNKTLGGFAQSKAKEFNQKRPDITFADMTDEDEAVEELEEIREFLAAPDKFHKVGARIPHGVLLYGPPGTGKTLLTEAVVGEAHVPFFSISDSEFVELYAGVGASRVRGLFGRAEKASPAIIFVDEIDAVGRHRGSGIGGGNDEREQTLNQLLVEMDGFDERANIILVTVTNRPDILDPALLRPGRFDRQIAVETPDLKGREVILKVHAAGKPMTKQIDLFQIAKRIPGFTGADLTSVLNEAALLTVRSNADLIDDRATGEAIDRVITGPQEHTRVTNDHDKTVTAYHEGEHALCAAVLRYTDPAMKVMILPRERALGCMMVIPTEDRYNKTRNQLLDDLVYAVGGRVAEEIVFRGLSTGPVDDIQQATRIARTMVTDYGMSSHVSLVKLGTTDTEAFGHGGAGESYVFSDEMAGITDDEVCLFPDAAMREAWEILAKNRDVLDTLAARLLEEETLDEAQLAKIFEAVCKQDERPAWNYGTDAVIPGARLGEPAGIPTAETQTDSAPLDADEGAEKVEGI